MYVCVLFLTKGHIALGRFRVGSRSKEVNASYTNALYKNNNNDNNTGKPTPNDICFIVISDLRDEITSSTLNVLAYREIRDEYCVCVCVHVIPTCDVLCTVGILFFEIQLVLQMLFNENKNHILYRMII